MSNIQLFNPNFANLRRKYMFIYVSVKTPQRFWQRASFPNWEWQPACAGHGQAHWGNSSCPPRPCWSWLHLEENRIWFPLQRPSPKEGLTTSLVYFHTWSSPITSWQTPLRRIWSFPRRPCKRMKIWTGECLITSSFVISIRVLTSPRDARSQPKPPPSFFTALMQQVIL